MKPLIQATREEVYNAPTIPWNNGTYTPISNMFIMDMINSKLNTLGLIVKNEEYKTARTKEGLVKGVIGYYDLMAGDDTFGQRLVFRNSYDKSMCEWLSDETNGRIKSTQDVENFNSDYEDSGTEDENYIWIHKYEVVD